MAYFMRIFFSFDYKDNLYTCYNGIRTSILNLLLNMWDLLHGFSKCYCEDLCLTICTSHFQLNGKKNKKFMFNNQMIIFLHFGSFKSLLWMVTVFFTRDDRVLICLIAISCYIYIEYISHMDGLVHMRNFLSLYISTIYCWFWSFLDFSLFLVHGSKCFF